MDVSIDIETLGTARGSVILSIGAVVFDPNGNTHSQPFYRNISTLSCLTAGLTIDPGTVEWWSSPERDAPRSYLVNGDVWSLRDALSDLSDWGGLTDMVNIWAKPPLFDIGLLEAAYEAVNIPVPWSHRQPLCVRTAIRMSGIDEKTIPFVGVPHFATDDAIHQAKIVQTAIAGGR